MDWWPRWNLGARVSDLEDLLAFQLKAAKLPKPEREYRFHAVRRWRFDLAWPELMIAAEVDGGTWNNGRHARGSGIHGDCVKMSSAAALGWRVFRFDRELVESGAALQFLEDAIGGKA